MRRVIKRGLRFVGKRWSPNLVFAPTRGRFRGCFRGESLGVGKTTTARSITARRFLFADALGASLAALIRKFGSNFAAAESTAFLFQMGRKFPLGGCSLLMGRQEWSPSALDRGIRAVGTVCLQRLAARLATGRLDWPP